MTEFNSATVAANATNVGRTRHEKESDICLKCGNTITHIPYKYKGQTFHARCLVCTHCGKKLVGKPFITDRSHIYCGDQCKQDYEQKPCTVSVLINDSQVSEGNSDSPLSESLLDALESIQESKQDIMRLTRQVSPMNSGPDPDRITDYPRRPSPSVSLLSLSSRRSSLSAMSQSSLTSDSSFDANKKPGKKILKNPRRAARNSKNRVTWKLPNTSDGTGIDSDAVSTDSLESSGSSVYNRARSGVLAARQAWRDFENSPPKGSTGITPIKPTQRLPLTRSSFATSTLHMYSPPGNLATIPQGTVFNGLESKSSENLMRPKLIPSPLTYNTSSNNSITPAGSVLHSTPIRQTPSIRHTQSTSSLEFQRNMLQFGSTPDQVADINVPILRLDNSNLTDLEESTVEDKKRMHIFQFPQNNQKATPDNSRAVALLEDDDANDYDHLSPLHKQKGDQKRTDVSVTYAASQEVHRTQEIIAKKRPGAGHSHGGTSEELPPSIPPKKSRQERKAAIGSEATRILSKPVSVSLSHRQSRAARHDTVSSPQIPPPVPPKMRRKKQKQQSIFPTSGNAQEVPYQRGSPRDEIISPLPEFSTGSRPDGTNTSSPESHRSAEEDLTSSVSNTTLVEEEHTKSTSSRAHHTIPSPATTTIYQQPTQQTDTKQPWSMQGIQDRIVEGAEDPGPPIDKWFKPSDSHFQPPTHNFKPLDLHHQTSQRRQHYFHDTTSVSGSHSQSDVIPMDFKITPHYSQQAHTQEASTMLKEVMTSPISPRYKISLETALAEGNVMQGVPLKHPATTHQPSESSRSAVERNQPANRPHHPIPGSNSVGQNLQPATSLDVHFSTEEQEVRKRFYSGGKLPVEKPVVHVKSQSSVSQLLKELDIKDKKHAANVTCKVCKKTIQGSSYTMNGESYHSRCYKCAICGSVLRGKKSFTVNNKLFCKDCHARQERSLGHAIYGTSQQQTQHTKPSRDFQMPPAAATAGRQMTSV